MGSKRRALPIVKELAKEGGTAVTIAHVVERVEGAGAVGPPRRADEREVQAHLHQVAAGLSEEGINASVEIRGDVRTRPATEITNIARETGADLIIA